MTRAIGEVRDLGCIRVVAKGRGASGVVVSIEVAMGGGWREVVKIDAFGRAHWHLYTMHDGEHVEAMPDADGLRGADAIVATLPRHLARAGCSEAAEGVSDPDELLRVRLAVTDAIEAIQRAQRDEEAGVRPM